MYYNRCLENPKFLRLLKEGEPLRPLVDLTKEYWKDKKRRPKVRPDLQFRTDAISLYLGLTKVLQIHMDKKGCLHPSAAGAYELRDLGVQPTYRQEQCTDLVADILRYLERVDVDDRYLSDEGRCQNWLSYHNGAQHVPGRGVPLAIDREVVIGYKDEGEKTELFREAIRKPALEVIKGISKAKPKRYGENLQKLPLGNELDLLMWDSSGAFLATEVKGGGNPHGIYMAPVQMAAYLLAWRDFAKVDPLKGVKCLVEQKRELGLVTMDGTEWNQFSASLSAPHFVPVLVVQRPNRNSSCWKKLCEVTEYVSTMWPDGRGPSIMDSLRVYTVENPEGDLEDHTEDYPSWGPAA